jgi:hypothetical protein
MRKQLTEKQIKQRKRYAQNRYNKIHANEETLKAFKEQQRLYLWIIMF